MRRTFNLNIAARTERHVLTGGDRQLQFFNKGRFVIVRDNAKDFVRQLDFHILPYSDLAGQTTTLFCFTLGDMRKLGRQNITTALFHRHPALTAGPTAAAGGGDKDAVAGQRIQQLIARRGFDLLIRFIVDFDNHIAGVHQLRFGKQNQQRQHQYDQRKHDYAQ